MMRDSLVEHAHTIRSSESPESNEVKVLRLNSVRKQFTIG